MPRPFYDVRDVREAARVLLWRLTHRAARPRAAWNTKNARRLPSHRAFLLTARACLVRSLFLPRPPHDGDDLAASEEGRADRDADELIPGGGRLKNLLLHGRS